MPLETVDSLVDALRGRPILRPEQLDELVRVRAPATADTQELARSLIRSGWLTVYQAKKIISGKADELVIGPYVVLDKLGEGGMGKVYKALQLSLGRVVALKVVRASLLKNETAMKRFLREVKTAADLRHLNIVTVFDSDQVGDRHFLAMEHIAGVDLARLVKDRGRLPISMACSYVRQAALGLQHAHDRKMVHRDIKPSNLLVAADTTGQYTARNVVKILDMGLARMRQEEGGDNLSSELTQTGTVVGTPDFMSPEQAKNSSSVDHRSDLYALGCTLFYLLTGEVPFPTGTPLEKLLQHQMDAPRPVQLLRLEVPPEVATITHTLLAKRPEDRFQSGAALAHALEPWTTSAGQSGILATTILAAEAVDPSTANLETNPEDPFDFASAAPPPTAPRVAGEPPPLPRPTTRPNHRPRARPRKKAGTPWMMIVAVVVLAALTIGLGTAILLAGKKKAEEPPASQDPSRTVPAKR